MSFSGNSSIGKVHIAQETTLELSATELFGKGKLLIENQADGTITTILLTESTIKLEEGEYEVFLSGKRLWGSILITTDPTDKARKTLKASPSNTHKGRRLLTHYYRIHTSCGKQSPSPSTHRKRSFRQYRVKGRALTEF